MRPCNHAGQAPQPDTCRVCFWYVHSQQYRALWASGEPAEFGLAPEQPTGPARSLPCIYLGEVTDRLGCACPARWLRGCALHGTCTIERCKACPDYDALE
jgi:hypothetical protein